MNGVEDVRSALIVASSEYQDQGLRRLRAPGRDAEALGAVLRDPQIGDFEVRTLLNEPAHEVNLAVEEFFADRRPDDLLLVHFSCHGIKDEGGALYFAAANTRLRRLGATAVAAEFVNRCMSRSRSRRVVLLLDCCYAGAFERGMTARAGTGVAIKEQFGGRGRAVITASSAMEYAFEGDELADAHELSPSVFTSALVTGLQTGDADRDQDGRVGLDELYDYVYDTVRAATPNQTPGKWTFGVQGELYIARRSRPVTTPAPLPAELQQAIDSPFAGVRAGAVPELERLLPSRHAGLALAATLTLQRLAEDDSRMVSATATAALSTLALPTSDLPPPTPQPVQPAATRQEATRSAAAPTPTTTPFLAEPTPAPTAPGDRYLQIAGLLAIVSAALLVTGLFPAYRHGNTLESELPGASGYVVVIAALALGVGFILIPRSTRRLINPGLLLGITTASTWGLVALVSDWLDGGGNYFHSGFWMEFTGHLTLIFAACFAGLALARTADIHLMLPPKGLPAWLVVVLGVVSALAMLVFQNTADSDWDGALAQLIWTAILTLIVPACATVTAPRRFGAALLRGWIAGSASLLAYAFLAVDSTYFSLVLTLPALLIIAAIPLARAAPTTSQAKPTAQS